MGGLRRPPAMVSSIQVDLIDHVHIEIRPEFSLAFRASPTYAEIMETGNALFP